MIKRWYCSASHWRLGDLMVANITFLSFLLFSMWQSIQVVVNAWLNCSFFYINVYNIRVHLFYYLKWHHLVNRLPFDNATLKLQHHHAVDRRLAHKKDKRCVCGPRDQGQQSILMMRRFWLIVNASVKSRGDYKWTLQQHGHGAPSHTSHRHKQFLTWKCHSSSQTWHCDQYTIQIWIRWTICCLGSASGDGFPLQEMTVQELKKCNSRCVTTTVTSVPWPLKYQRMAASRW